MLTRFCQKAQTLYRETLTSSQHENFIDYVLFIPILHDQCCFCQRTQDTMKRGTLKFFRSIFFSALTRLWAITHVTFNIFTPPLYHFLNPMLFRVSSLLLPTPVAPVKLLFAWCETPFWDPSTDVLWEPQLVRKPRPHLHAHQDTDHHSRPMTTSSSLLPIMWMNWTAINHASKKTSEVSVPLNRYSLEHLPQAITVFIY